MLNHLHQNLKQIQKVTVETESHTEATTIRTETDVSNE